MSEPEKYPQNTISSTTAHRPGRCWTKLHELRDGDVETRDCFQMAAIRKSVPHTSVPDHQRCLFRHHPRCSSLLFCIIIMITNSSHHHCGRRSRHRPQAALNDARPRAFSSNLLVLCMSSSRSFSFTHSVSPLRVLLNFFITVFPDGRIPLSLQD